MTIGGQLYFTIYIPVTAPLAFLSCIISNPSYKYLVVTPLIVFSILLPKASYLNEAVKAEHEGVNPLIATSWFLAFHVYVVVP